MKKIWNRVLNFIKDHILRLALALVLIALAFVAPLLTSAQYKWNLNDYTVIRATEFYFASNYLNDSSKTSYYHMTGWNGLNQPIQDIEIRNFENALLANKTGENAEYVFTWDIKTFIITEQSNGTETYREADESEGYTISQVKKNNNEIRDNGVNIFTGTLTGNGYPQKDVYSFTVSSPEEGTPGWGSYIQVTMYAENVKFKRNARGEVITDENGNALYDETDSFKRQISCILEYVLTSTSGFITKFDTVDSAGFKDFSLDIGTGYSPSAQGESQTVTVWWDNSKISINPFNVTFQTMLQKESTLATYYREQYSEDRPDISSLTITELGSNATRTLDFYKDVTLILNYYGTDHNLTKTDSWFFRDSDPPEGYTAFDSIEYLVAKNVRPENADAGKLLGYYVEEDQSE